MVGQNFGGRWVGGEDRHAYPRDLALFVRERWGEAAGLLPQPEVLERILSACYQASLLREEERQISFRLVLAGPERFVADDSPPSGPHRLEFPRSRPFEVEELRRLAPAAPFDRSLIGVKLDGEPGIWGLVHTGRRRGAGDGQPGVPMPPDAPVVLVGGPGRIEVRRGSSDTVARLAEGRLSGSAATVYDSAWLPAAFATVRGELMELHLAARAEAKEPWAELDGGVTRKMAQRMVRRLIQAVRDSRHGGTIIIVSPELADELAGENRYVRLKYRFADDEPRRRFRVLIVGLTNALARTYGLAGHETVGWSEYEASRGGELSGFEEAILEFSHLVAGLAAVDGAVVMTKRFELLGFGGEISGDLLDVKTVARALDVEGDRVVMESPEGVGTRHRSAYRLAAALPEAVIVVLSQDGSARFVKGNAGQVTYWDQA